MSIEKKILDCSHSLFIKNGIRNVTMDAIAQALGMSKRTIYEHFPDKSTLVYEEAKQLSAFMKEKTETLINEADNVIQGVTRVLAYVKDMLDVVSPLYFVDMQRHYSDAYELVSRKKSVRKGDITLYLVERGVEEGFFRKDLNKKLVAHFFTSIVVTDHRSVSELEGLCYGDFERDVLFAYMMGIATDEGRRLIAKEQRSYFERIPNYGVSMPTCDFLEK